MSIFWFILYNYITMHHAKNIKRNVTRKLAFNVKGTLEHHHTTYRMCR